MDWDSISRRLQVELDEPDEIHKAALHRMMLHGLEMTCTACCACTALDGWLQLFSWRLKRYYNLRQLTAPTIVRYRSSKH